MAKEYRDLHTLRELYWVRGLSEREVASVLNVARSTIRRWMDKLDIPKRPSCRDMQPTVSTRPDGYVRAQTSIDGTTRTFYIHRLTAVAEYGFESVAGKQVHHRNGVKWDNRPANLELLSRSEHTTEHLEEEHRGRPYRDEETLRRLYEDEGRTTVDIAERLGCSHETVRRWLHHYGVEVKA